jgi:regulation of enolase protein 1 (concanavalin A-like superfamily)
MQLRTALATIAVALGLQANLQAQTYTDNFDTYHDYSSGDVSGTMWDGILNPENLDPGSDTTDGVLHWRNTGEGWENSNASGPVLYKLVPGDFDAEVYMPSIANIQWSDGGIIARLPDNSAGENYVTVKAFAPGGADGARWAVNGAGQNQSLSALRPYVRLQRRGTLFKFSTKANAADAWSLGYTLDRPDMPGELQVGLWHGTFSGNSADRQFDNFVLYLPVGPTLTSTPLSTNVFAGDSASFSVAATGIDPLAYQWKHAGTNLPGATDATLTLPVVHLTDAGAYTVVVSDADGSTESEPATLGVAVFAAQPVPTKAMVGGSASFSVTAYGVGAISYQWQHAGTNLPGATKATLALDKLTTDDAGPYRVVVTDADASTPSADAQLEVFVSGQLFGDNFDTFHDYTSGDVTDTIWDGILNPGNLDPASDTTDGVLHWRNTGEGWENNNGSGPVLYKVVSGDFDAEVYMPYISNVQWSDGGIIARLPDNSAGENYVTTKAFGTGGNDGARWAVNGVGNSHDLTTSLQPYVRLQRRGTAFKFSSKANASDAWSAGYTLDRADMAGDLEVGLWHGTFVGNSADRQFDNFWLHILAGPVITTQPTPSQIVIAGTNLSLTVVAAGIDPIQYQWRHNGTNIPGATADTLNLDNVQLADAGDYMVVVTDADGSTDSDPAHLTVWLGVSTVTDDFETYHDYTGGDVTGTIWTGVLNFTNLDATALSDTTDGVLHWRCAGGGWGWENGNNTGPVLYRDVSGDFDAEVFMTAISNVQWSDGGIMARMPNPTNGENWVSVKCFGTGNTDGARWVINGVGNSQDIGAMWPYVRLQHTGTAFNFYSKNNPDDDWTLGYTLDRPDMAGTLQVGLWHGTFSANAAERQFDNFSLTTPIMGGPSLTITCNRVTKQIAISWQGTGFKLQQATKLTDPAGWTDVPSGDTSPVILPIGAASTFFRLVQL